jgi:lysophospholipase L1-like esterase
VPWTFGPFSHSTFRADGSDLATYIEFTDTCTEFWVYAFSAGGSFTVSIDGGPAKTVNNNATSSGGYDYQKEAGYFAYPVAAPTSGQLVFKIPAGALGQHTIRLTPNSNASYDLFLAAIEARIPTSGTFRVGNMSISGKSYQSFLSGSSDTSGLAGAVMIDMFRADLLILAIGVNDWQGQRSISALSTDVATAVNRQRAVGVNATNGSMQAGGDVVLLWNPEPDVATLGGGTYTNPSWDQYRDAMYDLSDQNDVGLIDLGGRWGGSFATGNSFGMFADTIHPNDKGMGDIAGSVEHALFIEC